MVLFLSIIAYLMGSIPSGYLLVKKYMNLDLREHGSGGTGATNARRIGGKKIGTLTATCDILKALIPTCAADIILQLSNPNYNRPLMLSIIGLCAILGHNYSVYLKFQGGKGVATTIAVFAYIVPIPSIIAICTFLGLKVFTKIVSIRSMCYGVVLFLSTLILKYDLYYVIFTFVACVLIFWRHRANIVRIMNGTEK